MIFRHGVDELHLCAAVYRPIHPYTNLFEKNGKPIDILPAPFG
jgi:hypothetical protein